MIRSLQIVNPLPQALLHYEETLREILNELGVEVREASGSASSIEELNGTQKIATTLRMIWTRLTTVKGSSALLVIWPALGYWDAQTWARAAKTRKIFLVMHDITPLRAQFGYSKLAMRRFASVINKSNIVVICHSRIAADELYSLTGITSTVLDHPISLSSKPVGVSSKTLRVLGQYKETRSLESLRLVRDDLADHEATVALEIKGRGWPPVDGWSVDSRFLSESEFTEAIASSNCVLLPYSRFYQSGVAVRCLESGVPVVAHSSEQMTQLYGDGWPGIANDDKDWGRAVLATLAISHTRMGELLAAARESCVTSWANGLTVETSTVSDG